jgi:hypothetical protein
MANIKNTSPEPVMARGVEFSTGGRAYRVRPLGMLDVIALARIVYTGMGAFARVGNPLDLDMSNPDLMAPAVTQAFSLGVLADAEGAMELIGGIVEQKTDGKEWEAVGDTITNPELFPASAMFDIWQALQQHQDLVAFFGRAATMLSALAPTTPS